MAVAQAAVLTAYRDDASASLAGARRPGGQRAALTTRQRAGVAAMTRARASAARRVARENVRDGLLVRARSNPRAVGRLMAADRGWGPQQFGCLNRLWARESGWRWKASNPSSGAYGIPQSLPGAKMASFGSDWATNPITQIKWGLSYISDRYQSPCSAWAHSQAVGWY